MIPVRLTRKQVREIDRLAVEQYKIPGVVLMENAARAATTVALDMLSKTPGNVHILCGGGNNGGDGMAIARHLHNQGINVSITYFCDPTKYKGEALANWQIVQAMRIPFSFDYTKDKPALTIDAIFGTGLSQPPRDPLPGFIRLINENKSPLLAIDLPSGMDCDTGQPLGNCVKATRTITFVAEKIGFANPAAREYLGQVTIGDIGCPPELIEQVASGQQSPPPPARR